MEEAVRCVQAAATSRQRLVVVTPNVNFVSMASSDAQFRRTVLDSHLSLVDGMPLVWLGRRMGIPFPERVAGSSLLVRLAREQRMPPLKVYIFGGEPGVSELAARRIGQFGPGLVAVGYCSPGFGSLDSISTPEVIADINRSGADLLILSLGAKKGHQWIARNQASLETPVITHLGAAVNFIAGTIRRAPAWMQKSGLEWLFRIQQEPQLFRRYWTDGKNFLRALRQPGRGVIALGDGGSGFRADSDPARGANHWKLSGSIAGPNALQLGEFLQSIRGRNDGPVLDISNVTAMDAHGLGLLYVFRFRCAAGTKPQLICSSVDVLRMLAQQRADFLLSAPLAAAPLLQR
jgi:N-acetylglucosaminyldiphosphoundecaprenol N-acetyl-beta-D-mannosaminyltransferase